MTLDSLLEFTESFKQEILQMELHSDDVRKSFFGLVYSGIYDYYIGRTAYQICEYIGTGNVKFDEEIYHFREHAHRLYEIQHIGKLSDGYYGNLNRQITYTVWTSFETTISLVFDYLATEENTIEIIKSMNRKIFRSIETLPEDKQSVITKTLIKTSFIPLLRKFNFIVKRNPELYVGDVSSDREFLNFTNKMRNCLIHTNGVYYGNEYLYEFQGAEFRFRNGEVFEQRGTKSRDIYLDISIKLKKIIENLMPCIADINHIGYPDDGQNAS
ncbi:hypothetical protein ACFSQJ_15405 [Croceitalea marina]|uniref:Cthe-2314-like HEPN domain-containing protein n=1 Tax=Croceitalea marina TaxID=1775166 RepID=A0ABW5MYN7_9FLAO